jgi:hypothetical protein
MKEKNLMSSPVLIKDTDFLSKEEQELFVNTIFNNDKSDSISWLLKGITTALKADDFKEQNVFPFTETPLAMNSPNAKGGFQIIGDLNNNEHSMVFDKFCEKHDISYKKILRCRINVLTMSKHGHHNLMHVDTPIKHNVFLYYLNDSDGDTIFFNKKFGSDEGSMDIIETVSPKAGTGIVFDGSYFHSSTPPSDNLLRIVLNIDYV